MLLSIIISVYILNYHISLPEAISSPRGIPLSKKDEIIKKLCPLFKRKYCNSFWEKLVVTENSTDLTQNFE